MEVIIDCKHFMLGLEALEMFTHSNFSNVSHNESTWGSCISC